MSPREREEEVKQSPQVVEEEVVEEEDIKEPSLTRGRIKPVQRGGRSRGSIQISRRPTQLQKYQRKPEIVCWQRERLWYVGVEVSESLLEKQLLIVQNKSSLLQDDFDDCRWILNEAMVPVEIHCGEEQYSISPYTKHLLFKLSGSDINQGRCVKSPSFGSFFIIIPDTWERDVEISGPPPISPQPVSLEGFQGHFFNIVKGDDRKIAFRDDHNEIVYIQSEAIRFELEGAFLDDSSENLGPLFGEGPIVIHSLDNRGWTDVRILVIGEEGKGRKRWRTALTPDPNTLVQELPSEVLSRKGGWYFIRFYNQDDDLIESLDFRFMSGLKDIKKLQPFHQKKDMI